MLIGILTAAAVGPAIADDLAQAVWFLKLEEALVEAKRTGHPILLDFSGSDWCDKCRTLKAEVFDTPVFAAWAKEHVVLMAVDMPLSSHQPNEIKKQNDGLAKRFKIEEYPSLLLVDVDLVVRGRVPYAPGGPDQFIAACGRQLAPAAK
jgi:protein disulfide-isomerase